MEFVVGYIAERVKICKGCSKQIEIPANSRTLVICHLSHGWYHPKCIDPAPPLEKLYGWTRLEDADRLYLKEHKIIKESDRVMAD
jgi:hypothetical protein